MRPVSPPLGHTDSANDHEAQATGVPWGVMDTCAKTRIASQVTSREDDTSMRKTARTYRPGSAGEPQKSTASPNATGKGAGGGAACEMAVGAVKASSPESQSMEEKGSWASFVCPVSGGGEPISPDSGRTVQTQARDI